MALGPLVDVGWLSAHLDDERVAVVDCRWTLGDPDAGRAGYELGHIPGAAFLDVGRELAAPPGGAEGGRHPPPAADDFARAVTEAGIGPHSLVVAYDESGESGAARLWWLLRHFGHDEVAVLDGGFAAWLDAGEPVELGPPYVVHADPPFEACPRSDDVADADELAARLGDPRLALVDARVPERYRGEVEPVDPVAGHIPGAVNAPFTELAPGGRFLAPDELRGRLGPEDAELVAYCGSGITAATVVLAAELAGRKARLYPGSWSEWSSRGLPRA